MRVLDMIHLEIKFVLLSTQIARKPSCVSDVVVSAAYLCSLFLLPLFGGGRSRLRFGGRAMAE